MSSFNLGFSRLARTGAVGTGASTSPGSRPARPVRSAADIVVVAGQSRSLDLELTSSGNASEVISLECVGRATWRKLHGFAESGYLERCVDPDTSKV